MTNQFSITIALAFSASSLCFTGVTLAANDNDQSISGKKYPLLTPYAHTNQDDEAKRSYLPDLDGIDSDAFRIDSTPDRRPTDLIEMAIVSTIPDFQWKEAVIRLDVFGIDLGIHSNFDPGFINDIIRLDTVDVDLNENQPGINALNIPAPAAISLLALAGLSIRRRRR